MCGIAGYFSQEYPSSISEQLLEKMQESLQHRGPDGCGGWISHEDGVGFTHRRLSIVDLSEAGKQPMQTSDGSIVITFNGEIYNHYDLRIELEECGYKYRSNTDTETILYAYQKWGIECINRFEGMFAFALFDKNKNEAYLVRDRIGIKPLYFSEKGGYISFASEIKALFELPWIDKTINKQAFYHALTFMVAPAPMTLYEGIYKLPAGFYAKIDSTRNMTFQEWYTPLKKISSQEKERFKSEQFCIENVRSLLRQSIKKRMMSDVPFGVFLSGGLDSSLNVALMSEFTDKVKTFNVSFSDGPEHSEVQWARKVATQFGTDHHEIIISEKEAFDFYDKMVYHQDEPIADCVCIPLYYVAKLAKDSGVTVVQVGEGADELFCGYETYARVLNFHKRAWRPSQYFIPGFARKNLYELAKRLFSNKHYHLEMMRNWALGRNLFWGGAIAFSEHSKKELCDFVPNVYHDSMIDRIYKGLNQSFDSYSIVDYHLNVLNKKDPDSDFLKSMIYLELKQRLPELLLMRVDKMAMAASIEGRVPFLDHKLVEFALHIPSHFKYKNGVTKYILKKAAEGILPKDIIYRKKVGFAAPTTRWFRSSKPFQNKLHNVIQSKGKGLISQKYIFDILTKHKKGHVDRSVQLWVIQNILSAI